MDEDEIMNECKIPILFELMIDKNISLYELSKITDISYSDIESWKQGNDLPSMKDLMKLADYFDVSIDYLVGRNEAKMVEQYRKHIAGAGKPFNIPSIGDKLVKEYSDLLNWSNSLTEERLNFLCNVGCFNKAMRGYLITAVKLAKDFEPKQPDDTRFGSGWLRV